jgi:membrane protein required for colicin V production
MLALCYTPRPRDNPTETSMNTFDAAMISVVLVLALLGFRAGLLRSLADILGYVIAAPIAVALTPYFISLRP